MYFVCIWNINMDDWSCANTCIWSINCHLGQYRSCCILLMKLGQIRNGENEVTATSIEKCWKQPSQYNASRWHIVKTQKIICDKISHFLLFLNFNHLDWRYDQIIWSYSVNFTTCWQKCQSRKLDKDVDYFANHWDVCFVC